jgi:hypothetical protein
MNLQPIQSSNLSGIAYDRESATLTVAFSSSGVYEYSGVSEGLYERLLSAQPHPWSAHGREVKAHPYKRIA